MDGKIIAYLLLLVAIVAGTYGVYYTTLVDDAQAELNVLVAQVESSDTALAQIAKTVEQRRQEQAREEEQVKKLAALEAGQSEAEQAVEKAEAELNSLVEEYQKAREGFEKDIAKAREETPGMEFFEMELANGTVLKEAKIQRVEETVLTILHKQGVSKVQVSDLHAKLKDRLRFGSEYALPEIGSKPPAAPAPKAETQTFEPPPPPQTPDKDAAGKEIEAKEKRILEGKAALARLKREISNMTSEVYTLSEELAIRSTSASRRYHATQRKTALEQQLDASRRQLAVVESELAKLGVSVTVH